MTPAEHVFYLALQEAVGPQYHITMKTRLADLVHIPEGRNKQSAFNQVAQKHIDFVLADPTTIRPVLLVELDDKSHNLYKRRQRDKLVDGICAQAGLRILHITVRRDYQPEIIRHIIEDRLRRP